jgi:DNA polymerase-3 subunit alpha
MNDISAHADGLTCLSGCMSGSVNKFLREGKEPEAIAEAGRLQDIFGKEHFFLEVMRNGMEEQDRLTEAMARLSPQLNTPLVATNDIHYTRHEDCAAQDALLCLHQNARIADDDRWKMSTDTLFFRSREQMNRIFGDLPDALTNTLKVAEQVNVEIELGKHRLPIFRPDDNSNPDDFFRKLCEDGFARLYPGNPTKARERLEYEMRVIQEMGFTSYFLIVWDLIRYAAENGIPVGPGRGSAAGSIVAYSLGITRIDPLKYDLIFERFLNSSRISMPDIDIDFCKERREDMLTYVRQRYGDENVCQIITFGKLKAKNALRDMARVSGISLQDADKAAKLIPETLGITLQEALEEEPELRSFSNKSKENKSWFKLAGQVEGLTRNSGVHAAGVIIADQPLRDIMPLSKHNGAITSQWDMKICEEYGLLKMDFLGLRTLTILHDAVKNVEKSHGVSIELDKLPLDDEKTFTLLQAADTEGVFQLESGGMKRLLAQLKPDCYEDIIAVLALFRPGPLRSGFHETYAKRKHGAEPVRYPHPILEDILHETYGVLIYQEQIMRVAQIMGGFSLNEADTLRKAMGKKDSKLMEPYEGPFMDGSEANGVPNLVAKDIWDMMVNFAEYGFNKSHSAGYAMVTYQAAWMKAHYPSEFYASTLTHEAFDSDKLRLLIEDARKHEIPVLPPCANRSDVSFTVGEKGVIRFGLEAIKGVGRGAAEAIVALRASEETGYFLTLDKLLVAGIPQRLTKTTFEGMAKSGAFDCFGKARLDVLADMETALRSAQARAKDHAVGQGGLFDTPESIGESSEGGVFNPNEEESKAHQAPRELSDDERKETLALEKEALGLYLTRHPLDPYRDLLAGVSPWDSRNVCESTERTLAFLVGVATLVEVKGTRKDPSRKYARLKIEDLYGSTSALAWPSTYEEYREEITEDFVGVFHGQLDHSGESPTLLIDKVEPLANRDALRLDGMLELDLSMSAPPLQELSKLLQAHPGSSVVRFFYTTPDGRKAVVRADSDYSVNLHAELMDALKDLLGPANVRVKAQQKAHKKAPAKRWKKKAAK